MTLVFIPPELLNEDLYKFAIINEPHSFKYVPDKLRNEDLCKLTILKSNDYNYIIKFVPEIIKECIYCDKDLWKNLILLNSFNIQNLPNTFRDNELCKLAIINSDLNIIDAIINFIPDNLKDISKDTNKDIWETIISKKGFNLKDVPPEFIDKNICNIAINNWNGILKYVPPKLRDKELYINCVMNWGNDLEFVPDELRDKELCKIAINSNCKLEFVPPKLRDTYLCKLALLKSDNINYIFNRKLIPEDIIESIYSDKNLWKQLIIKSDLNIVHLPESFRDIDLCKFFLLNSIVTYGETNRIFTSIPKDILINLYLDEELWKILILQNEDYKKHLSEDLRDKIVIIKI
jgi:hypothetical protein